MIGTSRKLHFGRHLTPANERSFGQSHPGFVLTSIKEFNKFRDSEFSKPRKMQLLETKYVAGSIAR